MNRSGYCCSHQFFCRVFFIIFHSKWVWTKAATRNEEGNVSFCRRCLHLTFVTKRSHTFIAITYRWKRTNKWQRRRNNSDHVRFTLKREKNLRFWGRHSFRVYACVSFFVFYFVDAKQTHSICSYLSRWQTIKEFVPSRVVCVWTCCIFWSNRNKRELTTTIRITNTHFSGSNHSNHNARKTEFVLN